MYLILNLNNIYCGQRIKICEFFNTIYRNGMNCARKIHVVPYLNPTTTG